MVKTQFRGCVVIMRSYVFQTFFTLIFEAAASDC